MSKAQLEAMNEYLSKCLQAERAARIETERRYEELCELLRALNKSEDVTA